AVRRSFAKAQRRPKPPFRNPLRHRAADLCESLLRPHQSALTGLLSVLTRCRWVRARPASGWEPCVQTTRTTPGSSRLDLPPESLYQKWPPNGNSSSGERLIVPTPDHPTTSR